MENIFSNRDKAILIGLYLSKFDDEGLKELGFDGINQAFNILGYSVGVKPSSIKNYRDEFDPYFPNLRKGWHKRTLREYCKKILDDFASLNFRDFTELIKSFLIQNYDIEKLTGKIEKKDKSESVAKRLITGKSAEEYFKIYYSTVNQFKNYELKDATNLACGFDFKLSQNTNFYCVEVKGLNLNSGNIAMTEKEFFVANKLKRQYCLFVVMNFAETPNHKFFFDPLNSDLTFKKTERKIIQINYSTLL
ncbi:MAG: DUF3883 domain-containing protein [Elusimicrobiota bacterium]|nr:DUF3883 domain-containing protein [Elusimicrobiota bacterium]